VHEAEAWARRERDEHALEAVQRLAKHGVAAV
jgi:hypothetical protein